MADQRKDTARWVTIDTAVMGALKDIEEDESRYEQFLKWGLDCWNDLILDHNYSIKDAVLDMTPYKSLVLPADCIDWVIIGIPCGDKILSFTNDPNIPLHGESASEITCPLEEAKTGPVTDYFYTDIGDHGEDLGKKFGYRLRENGIGYWQEDKLKNEIQFRSDLVTKGKVYLKYICDLTIAEKETLVPKSGVRLIEHYIHWMDHKHSRDPNKKRLAGEYKNDYWEEYDRFNARENPLDIYDLIEEIYQSYSLSPNT